MGNNEVVRNERKFFISNTLEKIVFMMLNGAVLQTFLVEGGMEEQKVGFFLSLMQVLQVAVILIASAGADRLKNMIRKTAVVHLMDIPFVLLLIVFSITKSTGGCLGYIMLLICAGIYNVCVGFHTVLFYKLPYEIFDMKRYGKTLAISGAIVGVITCILSVFMADMQVKHDYFIVMRWTFISLFPMLLIYVIATASMKSLGVPQSQTDIDAKISIWKYPPFYILIVPNFLRGFCAGILGMAVTIGYYLGLLDTSSAGILVVITNVVTITGCLLYGKFAMFLGEGKVILFSGIALMISMPLMVLTGDTMGFLIGYGVGYFFLNVINYAVPVAVMKMVDYDVAGRYNGLRMMLNSAGIAVAGFLCIGMLEIAGEVPTMLIAAASQMVSSVAYYRCMKKVN